MKGNPRVVQTLCDFLGGELAARDQYFIHSRLLEDWGLTKLYERLNHEMEEETDHADQVIKRILFLEGTPNVSKISPVRVGTDLVSILKNDLALEYEVTDHLKAAIKVCEEEQDYVSRDMLVGQLKDTEEDHSYWLEQQLALIDKMGLANYIQSSR